MEEHEARQIMREYRVERDATDNRSCVNIVNALNLIPKPDGIVQAQQPSVNEQATNMTANVAIDPLPYFS